MNIPETLKDLRINSSLTQAQLSKELNIGQATIVGYEKGIREPHIFSLIAYADYFECSIDYLVGRADDFGNITVKKSPSPLSADEQKLIDNYRKLDAINKMHVATYAEVRLEDQRSSPKIGKK
jgi:transcriptional regulator with XRE-family HTH domain